MTRGDGPVAYVRTIDQAKIAAESTRHYSRLSWGFLMEFLQEVRSVGLVLHNEIDWTAP